MTMRKLFFLSLLVFMTSLSVVAQITVTPTSATIDPGQSVNMTASGSDFLIWSPTQWLTDTVGPNTTATPPQTVTYTVTGYAPGEDKVSNGDFNQGNSGFTSAYTYVSDLWSEGTYYVGNSANNYHTGFHGHGYGGSGNFMIVNGASVPGVNVWSQEIEVTPYKYYAFSTQVVSLNRNSPAKLQFSINGQQIGDVFSAPDAPLVYIEGITDDIWENFYELWYSGNSTSAVITILNQNTEIDGNDFGLDDISFCEMVPIGEAQCTITINTLNAADDAVSACFGETVAVPFLDNDQIPQDCNALTCEIVGQAAHGNAAYDNGAILYTPEDGFAGTDTFRYRVSCGVLSAEADVSVSISQEYRQTLETSACDAFSWQGHTFNHSVDETWTVAGVAANGCDSIYELHLTLNHSDTVHFSMSACEQYVWHDTPYTETGVYPYWTTNEQGCDRLELLDLTIGNGFEATVEAVECDSFYWDRSGRWYYQSTTETVEKPGVAGCDSVFYLQLTLNHSEILEPLYVTTCSSYEWHGMEYSESCIVPYDSVTAEGCRHYEELHLTIENAEDLYPISGPSSVYVASNLISGIYTYSIDTVGIDGEIHWEVNNGWMVLDSVGGVCRVLAAMPGTATLTARFSILECGPQVRTFVISAGFFDTEENPTLNCHVYPNPSQGFFTIESEGIMAVRVLNMQGQTLFSAEHNGEEKVALHLDHLKPSVYFVEIETIMGKIKEKVVLYR